jgi:hypothetical protein
MRKFLKLFHVEHCGKLLVASFLDEVLENVPRGTLWKTRIQMLTVLVSVGVISH